MPMDSATMASAVIGERQEPYGAMVGEAGVVKIGLRMIRQELNGLGARVVYATAGMTSAATVSMAGKTTSGSPE